MRDNFDSIFILMGVNIDVLRVRRNRVSMMTVIVQTITAMGLRETGRRKFIPKVVEMLHSSVVASKKKLCVLFASQRLVGPFLEVVQRY